MLKPQEQHLFVAGQHSKLESNIMNTLARLLVSGFALSIAACSQLGPYRTTYPSQSQQVNCPPQLTGASELLGSVDAGKCGTLIKETFYDANGLGYTLYFIEFDDQGWPQDKTSMEKILNEIRDKIRLARNSEQNTYTKHFSFITYVHGWKNNAETSNSNVRQFRLLLRSIALQEETLRTMAIEAQISGRKSFAPVKRDIVGIYIGWRGSSLTPRGIEELTFWERKNTAEKVAQGSVREVLARLSAMADIANEPWFQAQSSLASTAKPVRSIFIGHSLGGHVAYTAFSGGILRDIAEYQEKYRNCRDNSGKDTCDALPLRRQGDLILMVEPAIEGTRYEPLHQLLDGFGASSYKAPLLITITSSADRALEPSFRLARQLSTVFESYADDRSDIQGESNIRSLGNVARYKTHTLCTPASESVDCHIEPQVARPYCPEWADAKDEKRRREWEIVYQEQFLMEWTMGNDIRRFCGDAHLAPTDTWKRFSPVWNIYTDGSVIDGHNDITSPVLITTIRQIYLDSAIAEYRRAGHVRPNERLLTTSPN